jgi:putative membrane protein
MSIRQPSYNPPAALKLGAMLLAVAGVMSLAPTARAADAAMAGKPVSGATKSFMTKAAAGGMYEVQVSKLAADHAANNDVKSYAQMLVDDHTAANTELMSIAQSKNVALPTDIPKAKQANITRLSKLNGKAFDTAFIEQVGIKDHREDIALFDGYNKVPGDADVKAFAAKTLPVLRHHFSDAQMLPKKMSGTMVGDHVVDTPKP